MRSRTTKNGWMMALLFLCAMYTQLAGAQSVKSISDKTPEQRAEALTAVMKSKLPLNPEQVPRVQAINLAYALKNEPVIKSDAGKRAKFKQLKALQKDKDNELEKVLTAEQFKQYQALKEELKEKIKERRE